MAKRITFSGANPSINDIWEWYEISEKSIIEYKTSVIDSVLGNEALPEYFIGMSIDEINEFFEDHINELNHLVSFSLLSSAEATFKVEYLQRVYNKDKDTISRTFRKLYKLKGVSVSLEDDLLSVWSDHFSGASYVSRAIGDLKGAFNFRNWLAHGRFWTPKLGRKYDAFTVFTIAQGILSKLALKYN